MSTHEKTSAHTHTIDAQIGDWLEARSIHGGSPRRGEVVEVIGAPGHEHYRVRWDETHESFVFPADGVSVLPRHEKAAAKR
jgi:Domain of unknown function (DUF1918)